MKDIAAFLVSLFNGLKLPARLFSVLSIILLIILGFFGFEKISRNYYIKKIDARISLLERLHKLSKDDIDKDSDLYSVYLSLEKELLSFDINQPIIEKPSQSGKTYRIEKAISGASLWILMLIVYSISEIISGIKNHKKIIGSLLGAIFLLLVFVLLLGWIGSIIPTIFNPWINYIGFPIVQIILIIWIVRKSSIKTKNVTPTGK